MFVPLADALFNAGKTPEAIETLRMGVALKPGSRAGNTLLAQLLYDNGDEPAARELLERIVVRWPDATAAVFLLCKIYERGGLVDEASRLSSALLDYFPDSRFVIKLVDRHRKIMADRGRMENNESQITPQPEILPVPAETEKIAAGEITPVGNAGLCDVIIDEAGTGGDPACETWAEPDVERETPRARRKAQGPGGAEKAESQMPLFRLESMLSSIAALKNTNKHD